MIAYQYDENKVYKEEVTCQKDPIASKRANKDIYLLPADSTFEKPLDPKDGFDVVYNGKWEYKEKKKDPEPEPYVPTEKEKLELELFKVEHQLRELDYIGTKIATGRATIEDYKDDIAKMNKLANKVSELREKIANME